MYCLEFAGEDDAFAALEAGAAATDPAVLAPGLGLAPAVAPERVRGLAYTRRASAVVGRTAPAVADARALLAGAALDRGGTVAVRARDVRGRAGVDTAAAERELGAALVDRGFGVDLEAPDHELRALFAEGTCVLGWLAAESVRDFGSRAPTDRPFFQPGSMAPLEARAVANLAGARPGRTVLDPMCGTGGLLIEAGLLGARVLGVDAQARMVRGTRRNLSAYLGGERGLAGDGAAATADTGAVLRGDATALGLRAGAADAVVFDAPYGRQSKVAGGGRRALVAGALAEARRLAPRAVVVGDRSWVGTAREAGWRVRAVHERRVHRSLVRHVHVLERAGGGEPAGGGDRDGS